MRLFQNTNTTINVLLFTILLIQSVFGLMQRKEFGVPLPLLTVSMDNGRFSEVFVNYGSVHEGWAIADVDDRYVKDTQKSRLDHTFRELPPQAYLISPYEAQVLNKVVEAFILTLEIYERDLKGNNWSRLVYLDTYFTQFFKGFYYLYTGARCSRSALPAITNINDSLFDNSFQSPKSDSRINFLVRNQDHVLKLRIASKELIYQLKQWQKKDLDLKKRDVWEDHSRDMVSTYELFIRIYFNFPPPGK